METIKNFSKKTERIGGSRIRGTIIEKNSSEIQ
jgi:hypothetical protein